MSVAYANAGEEAYLDLLSRILHNGVDKDDRTGVGTRSLFGAQLRFNLQEGFPLLTTKKIYAKGVFGELAWLVRGMTNVRWLQERGIHIWDEWADESGDLGPVYGVQWRDWISPLRRDWISPLQTEITVDQLQNALDLIRNNPDSRRIVVSAWNPGELDRMALAPCHTLFQFEVHENKLSCHMYQRSADVFLGVPFNIASYAALTHLMAKLSGLAVGDLIISFGDIHIYRNHIDQVNEQLLRRPGPLPTLRIADHITSLDDALEPEDFILEGYYPQSAIKAPVAV